MTLTETCVEDLQHNPADRQKTTADAVESRMKIELRDIGIPPRPTILVQIEQETAKDNPDFLFLAKLLGQDVALSAGVIKVANSPFFSFGKKVPTVQEALLVLGLKQVLRTIAGLSLQQVFKHVPNMDRFWDASATTAEVSAMLVKEIGNGIGIRPEDVHVARDSDPAELCFDAIVEVVEQLGSEILLDTRVGPATVVASVEPTMRIRSNDRLRMSLKPERLHLFDAETETAI